MQKYANNYGHGRRYMRINANYLQNHRIKKAKKSPAAPRYIARTPRRAFFVFVIILLLSRNADNLGYYYFAGNCRFCDSKLTARRCSGLLCTAANRVRYCQFSFC